MSLKLEAVPSPTGRNDENLFLVRVPRSRRGRTGTMAFDSAPEEVMFRPPLTAFQKLERMIEYVPTDKRAVFEQLLEELVGKVNDRDEDEGEGEEGDEENALDEESNANMARSKAAAMASHLFDEEEMPAWASSASERQKRWQAVDKFLRRRGASDSDLEELKGMWQKRYGKLPRNATEGGMGGETSRDRRLARDRARARRQQAFDKRWPEAGRLSAQSALETSYGAQAAVRHREPYSEATWSRWADAIRRIGRA